MKTLKGTAAKGSGVATQNLECVKNLIGKRMGLNPLADGTFNVRLEEPYRVKGDETITQDEYNCPGKCPGEFITLQHCRIAGIKALIMRPSSHEADPQRGLTHLELMSAVRLRDFLNVKYGDKVEVEVEDDEVQQYS